MTTRKSRCPFLLTTAVQLAALSALVANCTSAPVYVGAVVMRDGQGVDAQGDVAATARAALTAPAASSLAPGAVPVLVPGVVPGVVPVAPVVAPVAPGVVPVNVDALGPPSVK